MKTLLFEEFNYVPDKKTLDEEMTKRSPSEKAKMDKEGVFFGVETELLLKYGFQIKENNKEFLKSGWGLKEDYYGKTKKIAEDNEKGYKIIVYKISPDRYNFVWYVCGILKDGKILKTEDVSATNDYQKTGDVYVDSEKRSKINMLFNKIYFALYDLGVEMKNRDEETKQRRIVDPFGEEKWDK